MSNATSSSLPNIEELWTVSDVMRVTGMKRTWVYGQISAGTIPHVRLSKGCLRFIPAEVREWIARKSSTRALAPVLQLGGRQ